MQCGRLFIESSIAFQYVVLKQHGLL